MDDNGELDTTPCEGMSMEARGGISEENGEENNVSDNENTTAQEEIGTNTLNPAPNLLVNNHCNVCKSDIDTNIHGIQCGKCDHWFHAINCGDDKLNVSSPSSFTGHILPAVKKTGAWEKRFGKFSFTCDYCLTKQNVSDVATMKDRVEMLENKIDGMRLDFKKEFTELKNLLFSKATTEGAVCATASTAPSATPSATPSISSSETVSSPGLKHSVDSYAQVLQIKKNNQGKAICLETLEETCIENGISVTKTFDMKKDSATGIIVNTKEDADKLVKKLGDILPGHELTKIATRVPTITVVGLNRKYSNIELTKMIKNQNDGIAALFAGGDTNPEDLFLDIRKITPLKNNPSIYKAYIRVSNAIRAVIGKQGMRLYIGTQTTCKVYDHVFVLRCYKCQDYGHHSEDCSNTSVCGFCAATGHETRECTVYLRNGHGKKCINCNQAGMYDSHEANHPQCAVFLEHYARAKRMVPFYQRER
jgi:hypothetical protein